MGADADEVLAYWMHAAWLGADSFLACLILARHLGTARSCVLLSLLFGLCDGLASVFGFAAAAPLAAFLLALSLAGAETLGLPRWVLLAPFALSFDNMLTPGATGRAGAFGLSSAALAAAGLAIGRAAIALIDSRLAWSARS